MGHYFVTDLPRDEGTLNMAIGEEDERRLKPQLDLQHTAEYPIESVILIHSCGGTFQFRKVSEKLNALCCSVCMLRLRIPASAKTVGQLEDYLSLGEAPTT